MNDEQIFEFDRKGWMLLPGLLSESELPPLREHAAEVAAKQKDDRSLVFRDPLSNLLDHPAIVDVLRTLIANDYAEDAYGFRCDSSFAMRRLAGSAGPTPPHGGRVDFWPMPYYGVAEGRPFSWSLRVVWELNPVEHRKGGTLLLTGSHKSNFRVPDALKAEDHPAFDTYSCPAGSAVIFTEALCHASATWTDTQHERLCVLSHYLHLMCKLHAGCPSHETVMAMPEKRRSLFRGVWTGVPKGNFAYSEDNRAI